MIIVRKKLCCGAPSSIISRNELSTISALHPKNVYLYFSLGYPVYETLLDDSGLCQSAQNRLVTIGEDPFVLGLILRPSLKTHHELITNQEDRPKQGFICEIDRKGA